MDRSADQLDESHSRLIIMDAELDLLRGRGTELIFRQLTIRPTTV
jgi:hypothetical protein